MNQERSPSINLRRLGMKDILVLFLIAIIFFLAGWILQSEKTKYVVVVVKEKVEQEADFYKAKSKEIIDEFIMQKSGI
jgi:hypothetical protein